MKKYILLGIPLILYGNSLLFYFRNIHSYMSSILEVLMNLSILLVCMIFLLKRTKLQNALDWLIGLSFSIYFCILYFNTIHFLFFLDDLHYSVETLKYISNSVNLVPIKGIIDVLRYNPSSLFQIAGNTIMLTPLAFAMLYFKWAKSNKQAIWYSFLCTIGIELIQFLQSILALVFNLGMGRSLDVDDVLLNTIGAVIGVGCYFIWVKIETFFSFKKKNFQVSIHDKRS
ncbi:VanZ family protein [Gottfriedia luciferensis]|uniref:VanZ family protein n=1 Tax=Gottfriedia luciferensis TaxID=178774 RepID=UPI0011550E70|nr:VanZ family protein [Gottfriedia luciferensis]